MSEEVAIVAGGAGDIGFAVVKRLLKMNYKVAIWDVKPENEITALIKSLKEEGSNVLGISVDATDYNGVERAYNITKRTFNNYKVTVLVNSIGIETLKHFHEMSWEEWSRELLVNLLAPANTIRVVLPEMIANKKGTVINITSIWSTRIGPLRSAYITAKWGLLALTKSLQEEYREYGIRFVAVSPGPVYTGMTKRLLKGPKPPEWMNPDDIADVIEFVLSEKGKNIVGGEIQVYGWGKPIGF
ncbi:SDR family NAD(P)-dependent oxidoreductase [Vulcanisaeta thermophila]|uniref:SDR family NAD(P)-dependent oxidoreductase n=1 Tax=Vulcanisaeta thermophila TaxID=867917 RepID=UPI00138989D5|nr:SDR family oxidoreductase [Vulcanisaeta thermophila]